MWDLRGWDDDHERRIAGTIRVRCGFQGVPTARNEAVRQFLATGIEWLWWLDTDMGFRPDTLDRLLAVADAKSRPVVGALCYALKMPREDGLNGYQTVQVSTIYDWISEGDRHGFIGRPEVPEDELTQCAGTGSACVLIHRSVFERIQESQGTCWYDPVPNPEAGGMIGEDLSFCLRAAIAGAAIHVHTGIRTNHLKAVWLS
jgi:GT2 family glycosyltransferase